MQFQPKTEKQIQEEGLWPKDKYAYEIIEKVVFGGKEYRTEDAVSKSNNDMIVLVVKVYNDDGNFKVILDYLLESISYKLRHAAYANGLGDEYETGNLTAEQFIGKSGFCELGIQKDKEGKYADKNVIRDYVVDDEDKPKVGNGASTKPNELDDTIPF